MPTGVRALGGAESLWLVHTVRRGDTSGFAAPRYYQADVTGGTVAANLLQAATFDPDGANVVHRFMPSVAVDRAGDLAMGYSTSSSTTKPAIKYAGRLAADPVNTLPQSEQVLIQGTGTQTGNCGTSACTRWGDYSSMTLDPDGCTFWYTNMYYAVDGLNHLTRVGSFAFPGCTPFTTGGTLSGTVTAVVGGAPLSGATVTLGTRTTTTDGSGFYSFAGLPAGTYSLETASQPGFQTGSAASVAISDGNTTTRNFTLSAAVASTCLTDTTQADFQRGADANTTLDTSPGDVVLAKPSLDQGNLNIGSSGVGITVTTWGGQTFTPSVSGLLTGASLSLFCSGCTGTTPNLTVSVRATSGGLPTGADLASATITGFGNGGVASYFTVTFGTPPSLTAGTMYALVVRPTANPSPGTYALTRSGTSTAGASNYSGGTRVAGATSGTVWSIPLTGGVSTDAGFTTIMDSGFAPSGDHVSQLLDSNPAGGWTPTWNTLSFTDAVPASTGLQFQVAASNSAVGPFNFVGPDNTAGTFFTTSGASLSQFNGMRYLKYKALLSSTDSAVTPTLNDVTVCYANVATGQPDLTLSKSDGGASVSPGGTVSYTLTYTNAGTAGSTGVVLTETVPANTTFNAGASTAGWSCSPDNNAGSTCTLAVGAVAAAGGSSATFAVTVVSPVAAGVTQISNTASIADDGTNGADLTPGDNSASDTTPVDAAPDLNLTKSDGDAIVLPGGVVSYTLTYDNDGNQGTSGVVLTETVPANTTFNAGASTAGWSCTPNNNAGSTCTLAIGAVAVGGGSTATFAVTVDNPAPNVSLITNTASIADDGNNGTDPTPGDNSATDTTPVGVLEYYTLTPCRLLDTRSATGPYGAPPLAASSTRSFVAGGQCGVPADAQAISINVTVLNATALGDLRGYPTGITPPLISIINYSAGQTRANNAVLALGAGGDFTLRCDQPSGTVDVIVDVNGYFK